MTRQERWIAAFVTAYYIAFGAFALSRGNNEFVFYGVVMLGFIALVWILHRRCHFPLSTIWMLAVWGLLHMAGGNIPVDSNTGEGKPVLYSWRPVAWLPKYDQVVHALGFGVATLAAHGSLAAVFRGCGARLPVTFGVAFALVCAGMGLGALNEVVEFVATRIFESTNVGGYENTGWDLVSNLVGCIVAAAWLWWRDRKKNAPG